MLDGRIGLSLIGGGSRGAYQAGVVHGLAEIFKEQGIQCPFTALSGVSAGAINVAYLAACEDDLYVTAQKLCNTWSEIKPSDVYKTDLLSMGKIGIGWMRDVAAGAAFRQKVAGELLDNSPLLTYLQDKINFEQIKANIDSGKLYGVSCTAFNYATRKSISFIQANDEVKTWEKPNRLARKVELNARHVFASCAIPVVFAPVNIDGDYYGDGSLRNTSPVSPIINMGADKVIFIGVRHRASNNNVHRRIHKPSVAEIFGLILNGLFFDTTDVDIERLNSINKSLEYCTQDNDGLPMRSISYLQIRPSVDPAALAKGMVRKNLPPIVNYLLRGLGDESEYSELASYLMFSSAFTKRLVEIGYVDAMQVKQQVMELYEK